MTMGVSIKEDNNKIIEIVQDFVKQYMENYNDPCHDYNHALRVKKTALNLAVYDKVDQNSLLIVALGALLHDIADHKMIKKGENRSKIIFNLLNPHIDIYTTYKVIKIVENVSYSNEMKIGPVIMNKILREVPELKYVQDADRIDAIGAIGVMRVSSYGGSHNRPIQTSMDHFDEKLLHVGKYMKTDIGRNIASSRIEFMKKFKEQYKMEINFSIL
jgi:uncharacterized protein